MDLLVEKEESAVSQHGASFAARRIQHEIRPVLPERLRCPVDQGTLPAIRPQVDRHIAALPFLFECTGHGALLLYLPPATIVSSHVNTRSGAVAFGSPGDRVAESGPMFARALESNSMRPRERRDAGADSQPW